MTRFARAKGSKSSNEKAPEDSTPWAVMKEQLVQAKKDSEYAKKRDEAEKQRMENYNNFLNERKTQKRQSTWFDFPEEPKKQKKADSDHTTYVENESFTNNKKTEDSVTLTADNATTNPEHDKKKKKKKKNKSIESASIENENFALNTQDNSEVREYNNETKTDVKGDSEQLTETTTENPNSVNKKKSKKKNKKNMSNDPLSNEEVINPEAEEPEQGEVMKKKGKRHNDSEPQRGANTNQQPQMKEKKKKLKNGKAVRRKIVDDNSFEFIINGKPVQLVRFDGFPVMKRDAERLDELRKSMMTKGIPKGEVQRTLKLERRRAEKALARLKRDVCYNCRKGGHNLSDCPDLKSKVPEQGMGADGVCFKCGSTEHRQFECKVQRTQEFRFASCFICKEQGHIARQCPDNPKGLYPNGGGCKLCGDVTHLRKDCPTVKDEKVETSVRLETLASGEDLEDIGQVKKSTEQSTKKPKKIKF